MTKTLQRALAKVRKLAPRDQNAIARWLLAELESEARWDRTLRRSTGRLGRLADAALKAHREGRTRRLDPDAL